MFGNNMVSERYTFTRTHPTPDGAYVTTIAIQLMDMPPGSSSTHNTLKENLLKYITFASAKRLSPGVYTTCEDRSCKDTLELTYDDIKIALAAGFASEQSKYKKKYDELARQQSDLADEFEKIKSSYDACLKEIDEKIEQIPTKQAKVADLKDEIQILEDIIRNKKYALVKLED